MKIVPGKTKILGATFEEHENISGGYRAVIELKNGYKLSVVFGDWFYSNGIDNFEVAIMKDGKICYDTPFTDDVLGYQTIGDIVKLKEELEKL